MCDRCGWRELVDVAGRAIKNFPPGYPTGQQEWLERIRVTVDDDKHATDRQKAVVRRILKEREDPLWRSVPKAMDKTKWSDEKKEKARQRRRLNRACDRYGRF